MLVFAMELCQAISEWIFLRFYSGVYMHLGISHTEWMQFHYLVAFLYRYFLATEVLSATSDVTSHKASSVYTGIFFHLEDMSMLLLGMK
jgi:hypothetical protein